MTAVITGLSYNTISNALRNENPTARIYEKKLKKGMQYLFTRKHSKIRQLAGKNQQIYFLGHLNSRLTGRTVNRARNELLLNYRPPIRSVLLTQAATEKRRAWTQLHIAAQTNWRNVVFTDESWFVLGRHKKWIWIDRKNINNQMLSRQRNHQARYSANLG